MRQCPTCGTRYWGENERVCVTDGATLEAVVVTNDRTRLVGAVIKGTYRVESALGDGGMGVVYKVRGIKDGRGYAMKVLRAEYSGEPELVQRFETEARAVAAIDHPNIVKVYEFGSLEDESRYFVMELLEGKSLSQVLHSTGKLPDGRRKPLAGNVAIHLTRQLCSGLHAAHSIGIVHRDMKPDNVHLVTHGEDAAFVKVLDFGIAKVANSQAAKTRTGSVFGTPHYMSPEQAGGERDIDARTDVYAVGVLLYEMVCGRLPFDADNLMGILAAHMYHAPPPPRSVAPTVSESLESVILKALSKQREQRYASMLKFLEDLDLVASGAEPMAFSDDEVTVAIQSPPRSSLYPPAMKTRSSQPPPSMDDGMITRVSLPPPALVPQGLFDPATQNSISPVIAQRPSQKMNGAAWALVGVGFLAFAGAGVFVVKTALAKASQPPGGVVTVQSTGVAPREPVGAQPQVQQWSATVRVEADTAGAAVFRDALRLCATPCDLPRPTEGQHVTYTVAAEGRTRVGFTLAHESTDQVRIELPRSQRPSTRPASGTTPTGTGTRPTETPPRDGLLDPWP